MKKWGYTAMALVLFPLCGALVCDQPCLLAAEMEMPQTMQPQKMAQGHQMGHMKAIAKKNEQGMQITLMTADPETFYLVQGEEVKPIQKTPRDTFHVMVMLRDQQNGWFIPNTSVWMTIKDAKGKVVFDERMWPMLAAQLHYGNNVALPGAGRYTIAVQIGVPQLARHVPYQERWLKPFKVTFAYDYRK